MRARLAWSRELNNIAHLICHPDTPAKAVRAVDVVVTHAAGRWVLHFTVEGALPLIPPPAVPERTDGLWQTTCFELFVTGADGHYREFNFSPSTRWAAYDFSGCREGMREASVTPPAIEPLEDGIRVMLDHAAVQGARIGLSAVIEERDGTKSYWALAHPAGTPDFHHVDCFALRLEAGSHP
jgi:hypothetical protein